MPCKRRVAVVIAMTFDAVVPGAANPYLNVATADVDADAPGGSVALALQLAMPGISTDSSDSPRLVEQRPRHWHR